jgi:hypothetical protein
MKRFSHSHLNREKAKSKRVLQGILFMFQGSFLGQNNGDFGADVLFGMNHDVGLFSIVDANPLINVLEAHPLVAVVAFEGFREFLDFAWKHPIAIVLDVELEQVAFAIGPESGCGPPPLL